MRTEERTLPIVDKARAEAIIAALRALAGLADTDTVDFSVITDMATTLRFGTEYKERLHGSPPELIYSRSPIGGLEANVWAQTDITTANLDELPTAKLRQRARRLLGLDEAAEAEVTNG